MNTREIALSNLEKAVIVWNWEDAPEEFKTLSRSGGDEDFVAYFPAGIEFNYTVMKIEELACCDNDVNIQLDGSLIIIGSHA